MMLCMILTGGHWAVLQSSAWAKMVWNYSQEMSLFAAVEKTFGGLPCDFCKKVRDAWEHEEGKSPDKAVDQFVKVECLVPESQVVVRLDFDLFVYPADVAERLHARVFAPPVPVPIVA